MSEKPRWYRERKYSRENPRERRPMRYLRPKLQIVVNQNRPKSKSGGTQNWASTTRGVKCTRDEKMKRRKSAEYASKPQANEIWMPAIFYAQVLTKALAKNRRRVLSVVESGKLSTDLHKI